MNKKGLLVWHFDLADEPDRSCLARVVTIFTEEKYSETTEIIFKPQRC